MDERWLLLGAGLLLGTLVSLMIASLLGQRRLARIQHEQQARLDARIDKMGQTLAAYQQSTSRIGEALLSLREKLGQLANCQQRVEQQDVQGMPYNQASRLVQMGASTDDLMQA